MIVVTRLDGKEAVVNADQIVMVEETPDTKLTFSNGLHLVVRDPVEEIVNKAVAYKRRIQGGLALVAGRER